jgi:sec-independent protein translocase protein TatC
MAEPTADTSSKPFLEHLEDLRKTFLGMILSLLAGMAIAWPLAPRILKLAIAPVDDALILAGIDSTASEFLKVINLTGPFTITFNIIFWGGLIFAAPFILYFLAQFVFPGLTDKEKSAIRRSGFFVVILFAAGVTLGYTITLQKAIVIMISISQWIGAPLEWVLLSDYISFVLKLLLAFGLAFQLPIVVLILGYLGLVDSTSLREKRRHVVVGTLVIGMVLTPPEVFTQIMLAVPMYLLYECSIWIIWLREKTSNETELPERKYEK